jgi:hypothetical protein
MGYLGIRINTYRCIRFLSATTKKNIGHNKCSPCMCVCVCVFFSTLVFLSYSFFLLFYIDLFFSLSLSHSISLSFSLRNCKHHYKYRFYNTPSPTTPTTPLRLSYHYHHILGGGTTGRFIMAFGGERSWPGCVYYMRGQHYDIVFYSIRSRGIHHCCRCRYRLTLSGKYLFISLTTLTIAAEMNVVRTRLHPSPQRRRR